MTPKYLLFAIPILLALVLLEIAIDIFRKKKRFSLADTLTNLSCGLGNQGINLFTEGLKLFLFIDIFFHKLAFFEMPHTWWSVLLGTIVLDFAFYWEHRLSHEINILWGTHVVHHSSEEFNLSIALRRSWIADIVVLGFFLPIPMLGFQPETFLSAVVIHNFYQFIIHTRAVGKLHPIIEFVLHTPSHHRVHHARDPKYIDKNYSGVFIIWDRLFGTFKEEEEEPTYGITTPLTTNNPFLVNIHYYRDMFRTVRTIRGWKMKLRYLFARPGWFPEELGGFKAPPEIDKETVQKYIPTTPARLNYYVLVQFLSAFFGLLTLLVGKKYLGTNLVSPSFELIFFGLIIMATIIPLAVFDRKTWVYWLEQARIVILAATLMFFFATNTSANLWWIGAANSLGAALMIMWFRSVWTLRDEVEPAMEAG